ncbi:MAG: hypothetical protein JWR20_739 [Marmoricola sp.]|nr:hypothetical protein [Marmoricola sp.]
MTVTTGHLYDRHGLFLRREFLDAGGTPQALARLVRNGAVHRVRHGAYTSVEQWTAGDDAARHLLTARAVLRTARCDAALSHVSALALHGAALWDLPLDVVHLTRFDGRPGRREAGVAQHGSALLPEEVFEIGGTPVTSPTRTAIDITTMTDLEHSLVVLDWFLHRGLTTRAQLHECADQLVFRPGSLGTDLAVGLADPLVESVGESRCRCLFWHQGVVMPRCQVEVHDADGHLLGRVDFAWPGHKVFLEFDGAGKYVKYLRPGQTTVDVVLAEKAREERICEATGWRCIRLTWADLASPARTAAYVRGVLDGGRIH